MRSDVCRELRVDAGGRGRALGSWGAAGGLLPEAEAEAQAQAQAWHPLPSSATRSGMGEDGGSRFPLPTPPRSVFGRETT